MKGGKCIDIDVTSKNNYKNINIYIAGINSKCPGKFYFSNRKGKEDKENFYGTIETTIKDKELISNIKEMLDKKQIIKLKNDIKYDSDIRRIHTIFDIDEKKTFSESNLTVDKFTEELSILDKEIIEIEKEEEEEKEEKEEVKKIEIIDYKSLRKTDLIELCKKNNLKVSGTKDELIERLIKI